MNSLRYFVLFSLVLSGCQNQADDTMAPYEGLSAAKTYQKAKLLEKQGSTKESSDAYAALRAFHPESTLVKKSLIESLKMNFKNKKYEETIAISDRILTWYPATKLAETAYFYKGKALLAKHRSWFQTQMNVPDANLSKQKLLEARLAFSHISGDNLSKYSSEAKEKISLINSYLAQHEINVANYYLKRAHFAAAKERAKVALAMDKSVHKAAMKILRLVKKGETGRGAAW